ncbi:MAG: peptidase E [Flavobacteriaceae bacterium]|nr:peptidase E [Flavobacteriaceae bacterium]
MNIIKTIFVIIALPILAFTTAHEFHTSLTQIEYVKEKQAVQIISRIFIDDFEKILRERYNENITLSENDDNEQIKDYVSKYLKSKINIKINDIDSKIIFLGKEYDNDVMICYLEIENVESIKSLEIINAVLFDLNSEQQNIIRTNINTKKKSFILIKENDKGLLNF